MKKIITLILISVLLLSISGCKVKPKKEPIYIFYTSDVHCAVNDNVSFPGLKALIEDTRKQHPDVLLVDSGDFLQGGNLGSISKGEAIITLMNDMGYDYVTFGNHEFDYGLDTLKGLLGKAKFSFIASNAKYTGSGTSVFEGVPEYCIKDFGHTRIGFIGLLTPDNLKTSNPLYFMENGEYVYDFYDNNKNDSLAAKAQSCVDELRKQNVDYVIALCHLGSTEESRPNDSIYLISHTTGIDAVIDGHSHSIIVGDKYPNKDGEDVLLTSVGTKMEEVGEMIIDTDGTISTVHFSKYDGIDETMKQKIDDVFAKQNVILNEKIGESSFVLSIRDEDGIRRCRNREVTIGNLIADSFRVMMDCDIGMINAGTVRDDIDQGEITYGELVEIAPFLNVVVAMKAKGQNVLDALEFGSQFTEKIPVFDGNPVGESGSFMQVGGLRYKIDTSVKPEFEYDKSGRVTKISGDRRVHDVEILKDGEYVPLDPEAYYSVATSDYIALAFGEGNTAFKDCELIKSSEKLIPEIIKEYIKEYGVDERYAQLEDRIIIE
ncbi:MAG: bifunctional metallophosphatase/5'-nucleotidase [Erysipelotrichaceae bacterium]|nr:bifunctional metallophosphatase/5'-nucleotidase [Erysipelotrichaceae bacterium]